MAGFDRCGVDDVVFTQKWNETILQSVLFFFILNKWLKKKMMINFECKNFEKKKGERRKIKFLHRLCEIPIWCYYFFFLLQLRNRVYYLVNTSFYLCIFIVSFILSAFGRVVFHELQTYNANSCNWSHNIRHFVVWNLYIYILHSTNVLRGHNTDNNTKRIMRKWNRQIKKRFDLK